MLRLARLSDLLPTPARGPSIEGASPMANLYDRVRYPSRPFTQTHPSETGVFAALFGGA